MLVFEPKIPISLWWALVVAAVAAWVCYALLKDSGLGVLRRSIILALMAVMFVGPLIVLLNPTWVQPIVPPSGKPLVSILVDATQSMQVDDVDDQTRWNSSLEMASRIQEAASQQCDVNIIRFGKVTSTIGDPQAETLDPPDGANTNLAGVLRRTLRVSRPQGHAIALLSDGAHNVGSTLGVTAAADSAQALDVPIYATCFGGSVGASNIALTVRNPQLMTFPDRSINVRIQVTQRSFSGRAVTVTLMQDNVQVAAKRARLTPDGLSEIEFTLRPQDAGLFRYVATVAPLEGEVTAADNQASFQLQVIDQPIGVLLLEGKPYWDTKFLARNLAADPAIQLTSLVRIREDRLMRRTDQASMSLGDDDKPAEEKTGTSGTWEIVQADIANWQQNNPLENYRVIVLGRDTEAFLNEAALDRLREWISLQGGALVCARGAPSNEIEKKLGQLLPIRWNKQAEFRARGRLTSIGQSASLLPQELSGGDDPISAMPSLALAARPKVALGLPQVLCKAQPRMMDRRSRSYRINPMAVGRALWWKEPVCGVGLSCRPTKPRLRRSTHRCGKV